MFDETTTGLKTKDIFGPLLHAYTIREAIADKNVLGFKVDFETTIDNISIVSITCEVATYPIISSFNLITKYEKFWSFKSLNIEVFDSMSIHCSSSSFFALSISSTLIL